MARGFLSFFVWRTCVLVLGVGMIEQTARAVVKRKADVFPEPAIVQRQKFFWNQVFQNFPSSSVVLHDPDEPDLMIDIVDAKVLADKLKRPSLLEDKAKNELVESYMKRYGLALKRFEQYGLRAKSFGPIERRVLEVYRRRTSALKRLLKGHVTLRSQTGLADTFREATARAAKHLHFMEKIFIEYGVPLEITRLPFVESMFNVNARSKVGASGIWQFMPATARRYMYVNNLVDERNSPLKATRGAAKLLSQNFQELGSWPLAITAYNHGRAGIARAMKAVGSKDLGDIIVRYQSRSFGFASKNFYAEFLAAVETYNSLKQRQLVTKRRVIADHVPIRLNKRISIAQLLSQTPLDQSTLSRLNPCILSRSYSRYRNRILPPLYEIYVPRSLHLDVKKALAKISGKKYAAGPMRKK